MKGNMSSDLKSSSYTNIKYFGNLLFYIPTSVNRFSDVSRYVQ